MQIHMESVNHVKLIITDLLQKNIGDPLMPLQIHVWLNEKAQEVLMKDKLMPTKDQIKHFLSKYKQDNKSRSNTVDDVAELVASNELNPEWITSSEPWTNCNPFYFGFSKDMNKKPIINPGTISLPFRLVFTPLVLLLNTIRCIFWSDLVWHVDCTYKLNHNRFPLMSFGVSDLSGHFHPVYFACLSHEKEEDFIWFFESLILLYSFFNVSFRDIPKVIMIDAADASYNAVRKSFPNAKILMCYFHVKYNCKKNYSNYGLTNKDWKLVDVDIDYLHASMSQEEFNEKVKII